MTEPDHPETAEIYLVNAQSCSAGTGLGYATLPWDEAKSFVDQGYAVYGTEPPLGQHKAGMPVTPP